MPQPALRVNPASVTFSRIPVIESCIEPDTVQFIVEVAGLYFSAPAFEMILPAGIAPDLRAQRNFSAHSSCWSVSSTPAKAVATLSKVSSIF